MRVVGTACGAASIRALRRRLPALVLLGRVLLGVLARAVRLALRGGALLLLAVVGVVEARALEVDGHRVEDALHGRAVLLAELQRVVGHALHPLERVASLAAILVNRHGTLSIGVPIAATAARSRGVFASATRVAA